MRANKTFIVLIILLFLLSFTNESFSNLFALAFWLYMIYLIYQKIKSKQIVEKKNNTNIPLQYTQQTQQPYYEIKNYLSPSEFLFYHKLLNINKDFIIVPQVPLSSIIRKVNGKYQNELNRIIDFGIFDKNFNLLLLIELNDSSHNQINRRDRDLKVKKILNDCYIQLLTFHTKYPNEEEYITKRINDTLNLKKEIK